MKKYEKNLSKLINTYHLDPSKNVTSNYLNGGLPYDLRSRMYHWIVEIAYRGQIFAEATTIVEPKDFPPIVAFILHMDGTLDFYYYASEDEDGSFYYVPEGSDMPIPIFEGVNVVRGKITDDKVDFFVNTALYEDGFAHLFCGCNPSYILSVEKEADKFYPVTAVDMADL